MLLWVLELVVLPDFRFQWQSRYKRRKEAVPGSLRIPGLFSRFGFWFCTTTSIRCFVVVAGSWDWALVGTVLDFRGWVGYKMMVVGSAVAIAFDHTVVACSAAGLVAKVVAGS